MDLGNAHVQVEAAGWCGFKDATEWEVSIHISYRKADVLATKSWSLSENHLSLPNKE